ncbi:MAG: cupin domain-containing protein [Solirubrobacterales bacterium]|nr:cupin domain-containing protein [Solirubrobacterales bacterium]MCB0859108.1 cupin domain-containing protein [Solirubrobacterales bacterium]HRV59269.1 cupin domain-containing protein [Solirubrobacterales bacterium]
MDRETVIRELRLEPLPKEGGMYRRKFKDENSSSIYFLIEPDSPTKLHRLPWPELFHFYAGAPARIHILGPEPGVARHPVLGIGLEEGERPQMLVPGGTWQAAETTGAWTLLGTTMAPAFDWDRFELGKRDRLLKYWPDQEEVILRHLDD